MRTVVDYLALDYSLVSAHGMRAHKAICDVLVRYSHEGCIDQRLFYSPCQWAAKENEHVDDCGELVVLCDGGVAAFYFNLNYRKPTYSNKMVSALDRLGLYLDHQGWHSIVRMKKVKD